MQQIKAIETEYNGYKFRSRLEARWAVFFDAMGIEYQYEAEGYKGNEDIYYLPDFYLPKENVYVEVKGTDKALERDWLKIIAAVDFDATPVSDGLLILGDIPNPEDVKWGCVPTFSYIHCRKGVACERAAFVEEKFINGRFTKIARGATEILTSVFSVWFEYDYCDFYATREEMPRCISVKYEMLIADDLRSSDFKTLKEAYRKARQARFEHGETPVVAYE